MKKSIKRVIQDVREDFRITLTQGQAEELLDDMNNGCVLWRKPVMGYGRIINVASQGCGISIKWSSYKERYIITRNGVECGY